MMNFYFAVWLLTEIFLCWYTRDEWKDEPQLCITVLIFAGLLWPLFWSVIAFYKVKGVLDNSDGRWWR